MHTPTVAQSRAVPGLEYLKDGNAVLEELYFNHTTN